MDWMLSSPWSSESLELQNAIRYDHHVRIFVSSSAQDALTKSTEWVWTQDIYFLQFWELGNPRSGCWQIPFLLRSHFPTHRLLSSLCVLTWPFRSPREREKASSVLFFQGTNPILRTPPSLPHQAPLTSQKPHLQILSHWVRASTYEFWELYSSVPAICNSPPFSSLKFYSLFTESN